MYESPINAYFGEVETKFNGAVFKAIQSVGIDVNKDELIKALAYDREQYERGYHDGLMFHPAIITNADRIRAMTDEELAVWIHDQIIDRNVGIPLLLFFFCRCRRDSGFHLHSSLLLVCFLPPNTHRPLAE